MAAVAAPLCVAGCGRRTWNGQPSQYCTLSCRDRNSAPAAVPATVHICHRGGCTRPTWNNQPGGYCSTTCRDAGALGFLQELPAGHAKYDSIVQQLGSKWPGHPTVKKIFNVRQSGSPMEQAHEAYARSLGNLPLHNRGVNPGNQQRRFHSTRMACSFNGTLCSNASCSVCQIIQQGFLLSAVGKHGSCYGRGLYSSSNPQKAHGYGNAMFVVNVVAGVAEKSTGTGAIGSGAHSRCVDGTSLDELIVFNQAAMVPRYLIIWQ